MERSREQILDEAVYAVASAKAHYGPQFNEAGLAKVRELLSSMSWYTDATYIVDVHEGDKYVDFHDRIINPPDWWVPSFEEVQNNGR